MYQTDSVAAVKEDFFKTQQLSQEITLEECRKVSFVRKLGRSVLRVICTFDVMKIKKEEHFALPFFLYAVIWKEGREDSCLKHLNQKNQRNLPV